MDSLNCDIYDPQLIRLCEELEEDQELLAIGDFISQLHRDASSQVGGGVKRTAAVSESEDMPTKKNRPSTSRDAESTSSEAILDENNVIELTKNFKMGTATISHNKPLTMEKEKKPNILKIITTLFNKKKGKKNEPKDVKDEKPEEKTILVTPVAALLKDLQKLKLEEKDDVDDITDELKNFSFTRDTENRSFNEKTNNQNDAEESSTKDVTDEDFSKEALESRSGRFGSHSSQDSGYSEQNEEGKDEEKEDLKTNAKERKTQTVVVTRGPTPKKSVMNCPTVHPYARDVERYRQITPGPFSACVNTSTLTGGQVFVNPPTDLEKDREKEINEALSTIDSNVKNFPQDREHQEDMLQVAHEFIIENSISIQTATAESELNDILDLFGIADESYNPMPKVVVENTIEDYSSTILNFDLDGCQTSSTYPTPPYSENVPSPLSVNLGSPHLTNSEYTLSPDRSSPVYNSDLEKYQEITPEEFYSETPAEMYPEPPTEEKKRSKTPSSSLMTMKQYKDLQKEIAAEFSKYDCCQISRRPCKELFEEHAKKLKAQERKALCVKMTQLDTNATYGVLEHILLALSTGSKDEDLQCALFALLCDRALAQRPDLFLGEFGLGLLKSAALRCFKRPLLTRYLVQCVRAALRQLPQHMEGRDCVFHETDALGDTLATACARAGDACADVLAELVRDSPPLFRLAHANTDGYNALHVACSLHAAAAPRLRIAHVLLEHGKADLWAGDVKGGDTALHLAVNSASCELRLVMVLFRREARARWRQLAHAPNRSSVTPLEYARSQSKSMSRPYPQEVLDFLKKCR